MKIQLCALVLTFISFNAFTQITVTDNDIVDVGDILYEAVDSVSGSSIQIGSSGANQTWDFSNLQENEINSFEYLDPSTTPFSSMHPTSNICTNEDGEYQYFQISSTGVAIVGFDDQQALNPFTILPLPLTYPMQFSTGSVLVIDEIEENAFIPDSLAFLTTFGAAHTIDSINFKIEVENDFNVDGYGDVIIPMGSFPSLRVSVASTTTQNLFLYCTDTLFGTGSGWYPAPQQLFPSDIETEYFYQWWSNDPAAKFALVNIDVDEYGYHDDSDVRFLINNPTLIEEQHDLIVSVYPNPTSKGVIINTSFKNSEYILTNLTGEILRKEIFNNTTQIDLSDYSSGVYLIEIISGKNIITKKIIKE